MVEQWYDGASVLPDIEDQSEVALSPESRRTNIAKMMIQQSIGETTWRIGCASGESTCIDWIGYAARALPFISSAMEHRPPIYC